MIAKAFRFIQQTLSNQEEKQLQEHLEAIAEILYRHTPAENLKTFEQVETIIREEIQTEISPKIAEFFDLKPYNQYSLKWKRMHY